MTDERKRIIFLISESTDDLQMIMAEFLLKFGRHISGTTVQIQPLSLAGGNFVAVVSYNNWLSGEEAINLDKYLFQIYERRKHREDTGAKNAIRVAV